MRLGKLTPDELKAVVFSKVEENRPEVLISAAVGEDSAVLDLGGDLCVVSSDPITGAVAGLGRLAVVVSCNDVATSGAEPVGVVLTILAPKDSVLGDIGKVMQEAGEAAAELKVQIIGGHTEVTPAVNQMVVSTTVIGRVKPDRLKHSGRVTLGCSLIMARTAGLEGAAIIAHDYERMLEEIMSPQELETAKGLARDLSVVEACRISADHGALAMHDVTEGGVLGAVYEMSESTGLEITLNEDIPVHPVTQKICDHLQLDPLRLISSGTLLIATDKPNLTVNALQEAGVPSSIIGVFGERGNKVKHRGAVINPPEGDELWRFQSRLKDR